MELSDALGDLEVEVDGTTYTFSRYEVIASTNSYNSKSFRIMSDVHSVMAIQMDAGVQAYYNHNTYNERPIGKTSNARVYGKKVKGEVQIQQGLEDVGSDDLNARVATGILKETSIGFMGGRMKCDICGETMRRWMFGYYDKNDHDLGYMALIDGENVLITGSLDNKDDSFQLLEVSIVDRGADPGAKIIKQLEESLSGMELDTTYLKTLAEINNFGYSALATGLNFNDNKSTSRRNSIVVPNKYKTSPKEDLKVATPNDKSLQSQATEDALKEIERLTKENEDLQKQLDEGYTQEDIDTLESEIEALKKEVSEAAGNEKLAKVGKQALSIARNAALRSYAAYHDLSEGSTGWNLQEDKLSKIFDIDELNDQASHYRGLRRSKHTGGRQSNSSEGEHSSPKPKYSGSNSVYAG